MSSILDFQAFTLKLPKNALEIISDVKLFEPHNSDYDPLNTPSKVSGKALWDTGSSHCSITQYMIDKLNHQPDGFVKVIHAGSSSLVPTYTVNIELPQRLYLEGVVVTKTLNEYGNFSVIIGMEIIKYGDFAISNFNNEIVFSFRLPSKEKIDFVNQ